MGYWFFALLCLGLDLPRFASLVVKLSFFSSWHREFGVTKSFVNCMLSPNSSKLLKPATYGLAFFEINIYSLVRSRVASNKRPIP